MFEIVTNLLYLLFCQLTDIVRVTNLYARPLCYVNLLNC